MVLKASASWTMVDKIYIKNNFSLSECMSQCSSAPLPARSFYPCRGTLISFEQARELCKLWSFPWRFLNSRYVIMGLMKEAFRRDRSLYLTPLSQILATFSRGIHQCGYSAQMIFDLEVDLLVHEASYKDNASHKDNTGCIHKEFESRKAALRVDTSSGLWQTLHSRQVTRKSFCASCLHFIQVEMWCQGVLPLPYSCIKSTLKNFLSCLTYSSLRLLQVWWHKPVA